MSLRYSRPVRWWKRHVIWAVESRLLAWVEDVEPCSDYSARLLGENEDGDFIVPCGERDGMPWWEGYWRWWLPWHWPVYLRSRRRRAYVMVERPWL